jgi:hypothetical protein
LVGWLAAKKQLFDYRCRLKTGIRFLRASDFAFRHKILFESDNNHKSPDYRQFSTRDTVAGARRTKTKLFIHSEREYSV